MDTKTGGGTDGGLDDLLDIEQVKARLNMSERSVRTLVQLGHLPKMDLAPLRLVRFHPDDVDAYVESRRSKPQRGSRPSPKGGA